MAYFFRVPFALSGTRDAVPVEAPTDGSINFTTGYPIDYERNPVTDPAAKMIERTHFNSLLFNITDALQELQTKGFPEMVSAADNGGVPFPYALGATVTSGGKNYISRIDNNTQPVSNSTAWRELIPFDKASVSATVEEVNSGSGNNFVRSDHLRNGVRNTTLYGFTALAGKLAATDTFLEAFGKTQKQIDDLSGAAVRSVQAGSSNVSIDNADPLNPKISVSGSDIGSAPTKPTIVGGDGVVISDSADSGVIKRVAWSAIQAILDGKYLPSKTDLGLTAKTSVANADQFLIADSADGRKAKGVTGSVLFSAVHNANRNSYVAAGDAVLKDGSVSMTGQLTAPQVVLQNAASQDTHAVRRAEFNSALGSKLNYSNPAYSGSLSGGVHNISVGTSGTDNAVQRFGFANKEGQSVQVTLRADGSLSFYILNPDTGLWQRTAFTINENGNITGAANIFAGGGSSRLEGNGNVVGNIWSHSGTLDLASYINKASDGKTSVEIGFSVYNNEDWPWRETAAPWTRCLAFCISKTDGASTDNRRRPRNLEGQHDWGWETWAQMIGGADQQGTPVNKDDPHVRSSFTIAYTTMGKFRVNAGWGRTSERIVFLRVA